MSDIARLEYLVTLAYVTDTATERGLRWVKIIEILNNEHLLEGDGKKTQYPLCHERDATILSGHHNRIQGNRPQHLYARNPGLGLTAMIDLH